MSIFFFFQTNMIVKNLIREVNIMFKEYGDVVTVDDLCEMLNVGKNRAYDLLSSGEIKSKRIGRVWKIPKKAVEDFLWIEK